jgi:hypothetical protein
MNTTTASPSFAVPTGAPAAARQVLRLLQRLVHGSLTLQLPDGSTLRFGNGHSPHAAIALRNWNVCASALRSGDIGFAESYAAGDWTTPHLTDLFMAAGPAAGSTGCATCCIATRAATARRTSTPITTWATPSTSCGWTAR